VLLADLSHLNAEVTRYVLRQLDGDAKQAEPLSIQDEHTFAQRLINMGERVQRRATSREAQATPSDGPVIDAGAAPLRVIEPARKPSVDDGP
jgi:hypothetical protein